MDLRAWSRGAIVATVACVVVSAAGAAVPHADRARVPRAAPAWGARIVLPGSLDGIVAADGSLYSVRDAPHGPLLAHSRVVRIDPATGRIVAQSRVLPAASLPVLVDGALWVAGATWYSPHATGEGPAVLTELDPATLVRLRQVPYPSGVRVGLFGGQAGLLLETVAHGIDGACELRWLDPATGTPRRAVVVARGLSACAGALDVAGRWLYVVGNGPTYHMTILRLDARTGARHGRLVEPSITAAGFSLAAGGTRLWLAGGSPGAPGTLALLQTAPLRLLAESCVDVCATRGRLPSFGQLPQLGLSGGRLWVASAGALGCFAPSVGRALAVVVQRRPPIVSSIADADGQVYGTTDPGSGPPSGLVRLRPPQPCS